MYYVVVLRKDTISNTEILFCFLCRIRQNKGTSDPAIYFFAFYGALHYWPSRPVLLNNSKFEMCKKDESRPPTVLLYSARASSFTGLCVKSLLYDLRE